MKKKSIKQRVCDYLLVYIVGVGEKTSKITEKLLFGWTNTSSHLCTESLHCETCSFVPLKTSSVR